MASGFVLTKGASSVRCFLAFVPRVRANAVNALLVNDLELAALSG